MMSCSSKTDMIIWDLKGQQLERLDTYLISTNSAKISPCGRFVVATGFLPSIKVMEVVFTKTGEFKQVTKAFDLTGHSAGIYDVAFDVDTSHIATISKDGTWKLYHTKSEYLFVLCDAQICYLLRVHCKRKLRMRCRRIYMRLATVCCCHRCSKLFVDKNFIPFAFRSVNFNGLHLFKNIKITKGRFFIRRLPFG